MRNDPNVLPPIPAKRWDDGPDHVVAFVAERQFGVIWLAQLLAIGLTRHEVAHRVAAGRLHRLYRGVFAVGHRRIPAEGRWLAAVRAAGKQAALSYGSAGALWKLRLAKEGLIQVTVPTWRRARPGVHLHEAKLALDEVTTRNGIPTTTPARTLLDLATLLNPKALEQAIRQAEFHKLLTAASLASCLSRYEHQPGIRALRIAADKADLGNGITREELEARFRRFLRRHNLPMPQFNARMRLGNTEIEADCLWRTQRLVIELDGAAAHQTTHAFHEDRARDLDLEALGYRTGRITARQLTKETAEKLCLLLV